MKKRSFFTLLTVLFGGFTYIVNACQCLNLTITFCDTMRYFSWLEENYNGATPQLVALGVKVDNIRDGTAMRFKLIDILHGKEERDTITVRGDTTGIHCVADVRPFKNNDTLLIAVAENKQGEYGGLSGCGQTYLTFKNKKLHGYIDNFYWSSMAYLAFKESFRYCYQPVNMEELKNESGFRGKFYLNSLKNTLNIAVYNKSDHNELYPVKGLVTYSLVNILGNVIYSTTIPDLYHTISIDHLPAGMYFAVIQAENQKATQKIILP